MAKCRDCGAKVIWVQLDTGKKVVQLAIDPGPVQRGEFVIYNPGNPDLPMKAVKARPAEPTLLRYQAHRQTCPNQEPYKPSGNRMPHFDENGKPYFDE